MSKKPKHPPQNQRKENDGEADSSKHNCSRRTFLQATGTGIAVTSLPGTLEAAPGRFGLPSRQIIGGFKKWLSRAWSVEAVRKTDLLALEFTFFNLRLKEDGSALELRNAARPGYIAVTFPSQHILEQAVDENNPDSAPHIVQSRLSGPSRVVFKVLQETPEIPYSLEGLLQAISGLEMNLNINALARPTRQFGVLDLGPQLPSDLVGGLIQILQRRARAARRAQRIRDRWLPFPFDPSDMPQFLHPRPHEPGITETALELPYRLVISPNHYGRWAHVTEPYWTHDYGEDRVELWHTRLGVDDGDGGVDEQAAYQRAVRALWTYDFKPYDVFNNNVNNLPDENEMNPFADTVDAPLTPNDRAQIVHLSSNFRDYPNCLIPENPLAKPQAVPVDRLMLSTLGGWLESHGYWPDNKLGLLEWEHRAAMGRDNYVKTVKLGHLFPFGHKTVKITISERKFHHNNTAYLFKRVFLVILEPVRTYSTVSESGMQCPFSSITMLTKRTPNIELSTDPDFKGVPTTNSFWPTIDGEPYRFKLQGVDRNGREIRYNAAAIFVPINDLFAGLDEDEHFGEMPPNSIALDKIYTHYMNTSNEAWRTSALDGQRVAYAKASDEKPDDTSFKTVDMLFDAQVSVDDLPLPYFRPFTDKAGLSVDAIRLMTGVNEPKYFKYSSTYATEGFDSGNAGEVFLEALEKPAMDFTSCSDRSGGFLSPNIEVSGLSRKMGPVGGDTGAAASNSFNPNDYLPDAKIFGVIPIANLINAVDLDDAPKFLTQALDQVQDFLITLNKIQPALNSTSVPPGDVQTAFTNATATLTSLLNALDLEDLDEIDNQNYLSVLSGDLGVLETALAKPNAIDDNTARREILRLSRLVRGHCNDVDKLLGLIGAVFNGNELPTNMSLSLEWRPPLKEVDVGIVKFIPGELLLAVEARPGDSGNGVSGMSTLCSLTDFDILFAGIIKLPFDRLQFMAEPGKKPEIDVVFCGIDFLGVLEFIMKLKDVIPMDGFSDPPNVDVTADGLNANFSLALPDISVGVFSLQNLSINAGLEIPFIGDPLSVNFSFCTRENPCTITVYVFGGGAFVGMTINPDGLELLEMAIEFGVALSMDFGVASGSLSAMAGIYIGITLDDAELAGYFRLRGEVDVLGIISASIELYMELSYTTADKKVIGQASLEIEVEVACFSASVEIKHKRKFKGSNEDPTFEQVMGSDEDHNPWREYCEAFISAA
ncbi:MAG: hypothetical protein GY854_04670 [Deltaproteobacteria bacterium]|nr:hypothetical protein [Deltaproteobacteria bacterium]